MTTGTERGSKLRDMLQHGHSPLTRQLYQEFLVIESRANEKWIPLLGHDKGSHSGQSHLWGVEEQISGILELTSDLILTPAESFILLCGVIFHDLGKIVGEKRFATIINSEDVKGSFYGKKGKILINTFQDTHHGIKSAIFLLAEFHEFGFTDKGLVKCIAHVCAAHDLETAMKLRKGDRLRGWYLDQYGRIRLSWLCALLTLGDELDNSYHRAAPDWLKKQLKSQDHEKGRLRAKISGCEINKLGKLLEVHLNRNSYEPYLKKGPLNDDAIKENLLFRVWNDLVIKKTMLAFWKNELKQMHVNIIVACLNINGHLISPGQHSKINGNDSIKLSLKMNFRCDDDRNRAESRINNEITTCNIEKLYKTWLKIDIPFNLVSPGDNSCLILIRKITNQLDEKKDSNGNILQHKIEWHIDFNSFQLAFEPSITQMRMDRLLDTALQLRFQTHGINTIPWETLASEAGFEHIDEVKLIFHRIALLAKIYFYDEKSGGDKDLMTKLQRIYPKPPDKPNGIRLRFIELDGEWTIESEDKDKNKIITKDDKIKIATCKFHKWLNTVITIQGGSRSDVSAQSSAKAGFCNAQAHQYLCLSCNSKGKNNENADCSTGNKTYIPIKNHELLYLLDEDNPKNGILFPASSFYINHDHQKSTGINMVISGPAGVGKSTLSMSLINSPETSKHLYAYYSLEQPTASIRKTAENSFKNNQILDSLPETLNEFVESILFLPKLAPRTYGDGINEDQLFWFRYNQIVHLLELMGNQEFNRDRKFSLTAIVIDSLNAFSRSPLVRQQIHQLFRLISWYGILGIHIIENDSANESGNFQTEVEFLSDIAIRLGWNRDKYQYKVMEIIKSRCQRHVLGRHPFKIRMRNSDKIQEDEKLLSTKPDIRNDCFEIFPSVHTQVSRSEKKQKDDKSEKHKDQKNEPSTARSIEFSKNKKLNKIVQKKAGNSSDTGIRDDAFIVLQGKSGGHKLAIAMSYIHAIKDQESAMILNIGQPIDYEAVAGEDEWWPENEKKVTTDKKGFVWSGSTKLNVDVYCLHESNVTNNIGINDLIKDKKVIYVLNFHAGFLLPEEFLVAVDLFIEQVNKSGYYPIKRILFYSTAHLPDRYPLLDDNPLFLHALVRILKEKKISLMTICVKGGRHEERIISLSSMADINVNVYDVNDESLLHCYKKVLLKKIMDLDWPSSNTRVITSDNITGKDYHKKYALLSVEQDKDKQQDKKGVKQLKIDIITKRMIKAALKDSTNDNSKGGTKKKPKITNRAKQ